jgi:hypothetical protein
MSPVKAADPDAQALDDAFAQAMDAPARPNEPGAPPPVDPDAPHGRDEAGEPLAPFGHNKDGSVRKSNAGRRASKDDQPRIKPDTPEPPAGQLVPAAGKDYTKDLSEFGDAVWFAGSALGKGGSAIPLIGRYLPERKIAAQAAIFKAYKPSLVAAVNMAAQHNARAARFAASIESGELTWTVMCGFFVMPFMTASAAIWKDSDTYHALADAGLPDLDTLAKRNDDNLDQFLEQINQQMEAAAADAAAQAGMTGAAE